MFHAERTPDVPGTNSRNQSRSCPGTLMIVTAITGKGLTVLPKWAWEELNFRPHAYQSGARTRVCNQVVEISRLPGARIGLISPEPRPKLGPGRTPRVPGHQLPSTHPPTPAVGLRTGGSGQ